MISLFPPIITLDSRIYWIDQFDNCNEPTPCPRRRVKYIYGIEDGYNSRVSEWPLTLPARRGNKNNIIAIDAGIANLIYKLNLRGFVTLFHCSGLDRDHDNNNFCQPYILFDKKYSELLLPTSMEWNGSAIYFINKADKEAKDSRKLEIWNELEGLNNV